MRLPFGARQGIRMGLQDDVTANDGMTFGDADGFPGVESVVVTLRSGTTRTVHANVFRHPPEEMGVDARRPRMTVYFQNSATLGITAAEIPEVKTVAVAYPVGATAVAHPVRRVVDQQDVPVDAGLVALDVG